MAIDTDTASALLRAKAIDLGTRRVLVANLRGSQQEGDLTRPPNCSGFGRIRHFRRHHSAGWPEDPLPMDPCSCRLGIGRVDIIQAQLFQAAYCNWRCWYCYVPPVLLSANDDHSAFMSASDLLDLLGKETDAPRIIDLSGGQPEITPEWVPWMMREMISRGLDSTTYLWSDDNLSTDYFWHYLPADDIRTITRYRNYGKVGCFKGFDHDSFTFNTGTDASQFDEQFRRFGRYMGLGLDLYAYATFTADNDANMDHRMSEFCDRLQSLGENLPLRLVPLEIVPFSPMRDRMCSAYERAMKVQWSAIACWKQEMQRRFSADLRGRSICDVPL